MRPPAGRIRMDRRVVGRPPAALARTAAVALMLVTACALGTSVASAIPITGIVVDRDGKAIEYANVSVPTHQAGAVTDTEGRFVLDLPAGAAVLEVSQIGYQRVRRELAVVEGLGALRIVLAEEPVPVAEVVVAASSFGKSGKSEGAVVRRLDILTTPGGTADVFQALRALPGINAPDEGAALYVRGGDPSETLIRLDGGSIGHPYHYEGASGGLFSSFDAYMLKSAYFSSGGFASKYGGALSGVLDIETQDPMDLRTVSVGANLVGGNASTSWALVPGKLSMVGTARFSAVELLERLYGSANEYVAAPSSRDGAGRLLWRYSPTGRASVLFLGATDRVDLWVSRLNVRDRYARTSNNRLLALQFQDAIGERLALKGHLTGQVYRTRWTYGPTRMDERETTVRASLDGVWAISPRHELSFGTNALRPSDQMTGLRAADSTDYADGAPAAAFETHARLWGSGYYLEDKLRIWGPLYGTIGGRVDHASVPGVWTADPRASLAWRVDDRQTVRLATGRYHQLVDPQYLDPVYGNPDLAPLRSDHVVAGYEWKTATTNVRLEGYRKDYRALVTNDPVSFYANGGHGYARGIDLFAQGTFRRLGGWISYGALDSKRKEKDDPREVPSVYGVRHSVTVVGTWRLTPMWQVGARIGHATGRPFTPVIGRTYDAGRDLWKPVFGDHNSERLPDYRRLDLRLTKLFSLPASLGLPASSVCVLYVETLNALATPNLLEYVYNDDYSERRSTLSYFSRRMAVAGFSLTW